MKFLRMSRLSRNIPYSHLPLFRLWFIGLLICGSALFGAVLTRDQPATGSHCASQEQYRIGNLGKVETELQQAIARLAILDKALTDESHRAFIPARDEIKTEKAVINRLEARIKGLEIPEVRPELLWIVPALFLPFVLAALIAYFMLKDFRWIMDKKKRKIIRWIWPYVTTVAILTLASTTESIFTSVWLLEDKGWFSWNSYCVAPLSFWLMRVAFLGAWLSLAFPVTLFYCAGRKKHIPDVRLMHPDGLCGVGEYINRLRKWTLLGSLAVVLPLIIWLKIVMQKHGGFSVGYLLTPTIEITGVLFLILKMAINAMKIRARYYAERTKLGNDWAEVASKKPPPDPTLSFVGTEWWKLPTVVYPVLASGWFLAEMLGVAQIILQQFR